MKTEHSINPSSRPKTLKLIRHTLFLKWWFLISIISLVLAYLTAKDAWSHLWSEDVTKLSFALIALFIVMSAWCGYKTWTLSKFLDKGEEDEHIVEKIESLIEVGWFTSDLCLTVGMIGTVIGFIMMLSGFVTVDTSDPATVQDLIKNLGAGMSTSLYTTLAGLVCSILLKMQYFNLNQAIDRVRK